MCFAWVSQDGKRFAKGLNTIEYQYYQYVYTYMHKKINMIRISYPNSDRAREAQEKAGREKSSATIIFNNPHIRRFSLFDCFLNLKPYLFNWQLILAAWWQCFTWYAMKLWGSQEALGKLTHVNLAKA